MVWSMKKLDLTCLISSKVWSGTHWKNPTVATIVQRQMCHKHRLSLLEEGGVQVPREEDSPGSYGNLQFMSGWTATKHQNLPLQNQFMGDWRWNANTNTNVQKAEPQSHCSADAQGASPRLHIQHNFPPRHNLQMQTVLESVSIWQMKRQKTSVSSKSKSHTLICNNSQMYFSLSYLQTFETSIAFPTEL